MKSSGIILLFRFSLIIFISTGLASCGIWSSIFGDEEGEQPAELVKFDSEVSFRRLWSTNIGNGQGKKYNRLQPVIEDDVIYVVANDGLLRALDRENGRRIWQSNLEYAITGGVGTGGDYLFLGTENGRLIALDKNSGEVLWNIETSSEVLSVPASNGVYVVVQTLDDKLTGYDAASGQQIWIYESTVPALTIRGTSSPVIVNDVVLAGFGNGVLVSVSIDNGTLRWDSRITVPSGRSELERLTDVDAELLVDNGSVLAPSYQGFLSQINILTGQTMWRVPESSIAGTSIGFGNVYITDARGHVKAYRRAAQEEQVWVNDLLDLREVSRPVSFSNYIAVGDFEGYLHLLSQIDGHFVGRIRIDRKGLRSIQSRNGILYAYGNSGNLVVLQVEAN